MKSPVSTTVVVVLLAAATAACHKPESTITDADAAKMADATVDVWKSMDAAKVKALYAPSVVAYDYGAPTLNNDRAEFDKRQDAFVAFKLDGAKEVERKIQIVSPDVFVMSGTWDMTSSTKPASNASVRCTDVFQKDQGGNWPIVNEHCSPVPKGA